MFRKIVAICLTTFLYVTANAQDFYDEFRTKSLDVEGVKIGQKMTYGQFVAKFGKPTEYTQSDSDSGEDGTPTIDEYYRVGKDVFYFRNNGNFCGFSIKDKRLFLHCGFLEVFVWATNCRVWTTLSMGNPRSHLGSSRKMVLSNIHCFIIIWMALCSSR
uniref:hypothetical protein n=1 Tax=Candidatus Cryptobacteroides bacterium TaxID=3085639 RepID=UPI004025C43F